jgi:hypothetical protein
MNIELSFSSGSLSVNGGTLNLDGVDYALSAPVSPFLTAPEFQFDLNSNVGRSGEGIGALYGSGTPPNQAGGHFSVAQGGTSNDPTTYQASGIFATDLTNASPPL